MYIHSKRFDLLNRRTAKKIVSLASAAVLVYFAVSPGATALTAQSIPAEAGQVSGNAAICSDALANGQNAVVYGEPCVPGSKPALTATDFTKSTFAIHTGDAKMLADVTNDGKLDWIVGGRTSETLEAYPYPFDPAVKFPIATASEEFTTDAEAADMDNDGDVDVVTPEGCSNATVELNKNSNNGQNWSTSTLANYGRTCIKDIEIADFDRNGLRDIALRYSSVVILYQTAVDLYSPVTIGSASGQEGMDSGDIDGDGDTDLIAAGAWLDNPGMQSGSWASFPIGATDATFRATVADFNGDGKSDVAYSCAECGAGGNGTNNSLLVYTANDPRTSWNQTVIGTLDLAHTMEAADFNGDGDMDLVTAQMGVYATSTFQVRVYDNNGSGIFTAVTLPTSTNGFHIGRVGDIDGDGDIDFAGMNFTGNTTLNVYMNQTNRTGFLPRTGISPDSGLGPKVAGNTTLAASPSPAPCSARSLNNWTYKAVDSSRSNTRTLWGLGMGDFDGDGDGDVVAGNKYYRNPGGDMMGTWANGTGLSNASVVTDIDNDAFKDVIDLGGGISWKEWNGTGFTTVAGPTGPSGAQGYKAAQIIPGGTTEVVYSYTAGNDPAANAVMLASFSGTTITTTQITNQSADEGVGVSDVDGDGLLDIAIGDGTNIAWFKNPGSETGNWTKNIIGQITHSDGNGGFTDRTEIADVDNDGFADIIHAEETFGAPADTYWYKNPGGAATGAWQRNLIVTQDSTNSMDVADMDDDGDIDVITGEHKGDLQVIVWENQSNASQWVPHVVSTGKESHLGARVADLDSDGDKEILSIGYDDPQFLHLWRNDSTTNCPTTPCPAIPAVGLGTASYSTVMDGTGSYRVWVRMFAPNNLANSVTLNATAVNGNTAGCNVTVGDSDTIAANTWTWVSFRDGNPGAPVTVPLALGGQVFAVAGRESGVKVDQILLTQDATCVPIGLDGANCATGGGSNPGGGSDTTPPTVSVTSPTEGETIIGTKTLTANAADNIGVAKVEFFVDGTLAGSDTGSPFTASWNSATVANGSHTVTAKAFDAANNVAESASVTVAVNNPPQAPPKARYLQFDGGDYVNLGNQDVSGNSMALEAWIKMDDVSACGKARNCRIISKATNTNDTATHWQFTTAAVGSNTGLQFKLRANKTVYTVTSNAATNMVAGTWYHVAAVYDNANMLLYINGAQVGSAPLTGPIVTNSTVPVWLGSNPTRPSLSWKGAIDDVRIWSTARSAAQINASKDVQLTGTESGLQSYYKLNECTGQSAPSSTGVWNGTLGGNTSAGTDDPAWRPAGC